MDAKSCKVLVVDDNIDCAVSVQMLLQRASHEVRIAHAPDQALLILAEFQAEVVLMDVGLPGMDGYDLGAVIKVRYPRCRIIALTGYGDMESIHRSIAAGFEDHLTKPAEPEQMMEVVDKACGETAATPNGACHH